MERYRLKNIIILILVLVNISLLSSLLYRKSEEYGMLRRTEDELVELFAASDITLERSAISWSDPPRGISMTRSPQLEMEFARALLGEALEDIVHGLKAGARACVITFHSLEDRIIKRKMKTLATDCLCDKSIPICVCGHKAEVKLIKTNLKATKEEMEINTRSKSASLRVVEKI